MTDMNDQETKQLMWDAIEGALGREKRSFLQNASLSDIVRAKEGSNQSEPVTIGDAVSRVGERIHHMDERSKKARRAARVVEKHADNKKTLSKSSIFQKMALNRKLRILEGRAEGQNKEKLASVREVCDDAVFGEFKKLAKRQMPEGVDSRKEIAMWYQAAQLAARHGQPGNVDIVRKIYQKMKGNMQSPKNKKDPSESDESSKGKESKGDSDNEDKEKNDEKESDKEKEAKLVKMAWGSAAKQVGKTLKDFGKEYGKDVGKGVAIGTGATIPAYYGMTQYNERAKEDAKEVMDDARNTALTTAGGMALTDLVRRGAKSWVDPHYRNKKEGSLDKDTQTKLDHLSTTVYIDEALNEYPDSEKKASLNRINRDYSVHLLCDLTLGEE